VLSPRVGVEIIRHTGLHTTQVFTTLLDLAGRLERDQGAGSRSSIETRSGFSGANKTPPSNYVTPRIFRCPKSIEGLTARQSAAI